ncbi:MAG: FAD-binding oxidoreductase [Pseudomonadota bacterium]
MTQERKITLANGRKFSADAETSILDNALRQGIALEHSCKNGRCGVCKALLLNGHTEVLQHEESLQEAEKQAGFILTCCRKALADIEIEAEDLPELQGIQTKTIPARIDSLEFFTPNVVQVVLRTPPNNTLQFLPGQYISVIGPNGIRRAYSVANAPRADHKIALHIKKVDQGVLSQYWFEQAKVNDLLRLEGPMGTFFLRNQIPQTLILLATGTGLAPIQALLEKLQVLAQQGQALPNVAVYWGNRHERDIYCDLPVPQIAGIDAHLVLSRPAQGWVGRTGYVQQAVLEDFGNLQNAAVYACGSSSMIASAKTAFVQAGLPGNRFYSDAFVSTN